MFLWKLLKIITEIPRNGTQEFPKPIRRPRGLVRNATSTNEVIGLTHCSISNIALCANIHVYINFSAHKFLRIGKFSPSNLLHYFCDVQIFFSVSNFYIFNIYRIVLKFYLKCLKNRVIIFSKFLENFCEVVAEFALKLFKILNHLPKICPHFYINFTKMFLILVFQNCHQICTNDSQLCRYLLIKLICSWIFPVFLILLYNFS